MKFDIAGKTIDASTLAGAVELLNRNAVIVHKCVIETSRHYDPAKTAIIQALCPGAILYRLSSTAPQSNNMDALDVIMAMGTENEPQPPEVFGQWFGVIGAYQIREQLKSAGFLYVQRNNGWYGNESAWEALK